MPRFLTTGKFLGSWGAPKSLTVFQEKDYPDPHPLLQPGLVTLEFPMHLFRLRLWMIPTINSRFRVFRYLWGHNSPPTMNSQKMLRQFTAALSGVKGGNSKSFCRWCLIKTFSSKFCITCDFWGSLVMPYNDIGEQCHTKRHLYPERR